MFLRAIAILRFVQCEETIPDCLYVVKHLIVTESMTYRSGSVQVGCGKMGAWSGEVVEQKKRA
jgi:hypothetical protein